jgi:predicted DNA-binding antitoxin AbrB/MazE fold protein
MVKFESINIPDSAPARQPRNGHRSSSKTRIKQGFFAARRPPQFNRTPVTISGRLNRAGVDFVYMSERIEAIYENGVFRPIGDVALPEHLQVVLTVERKKSEPSSAQEIADVVARQKAAAARLDALLDYSKDKPDDDPAAIEAQQQAFAALEKELEQIPYNPESGTRGSIDHDKILYGDES